MRTCYIWYPAICLFSQKKVQYDENKPFSVTSQSAWRLKYCCRTQATTNSIIECFINQPKNFSNSKFVIFESLPSFLVWVLHDRNKGFPTLLVIMKYLPQANFFHGRMCILITLPHVGPTRQGCHRSSDKYFSNFGAGHRIRSPGTQSVRIPKPLSDRVQYYFSQLGEPHQYGWHYLLQVLYRTHLGQNPTPWEWKIPIKVIMVHYVQMEIKKDKKLARWAAVSKSFLVEKRWAFPIHSLSRRGVQSLGVDLKLRLGQSERAKRK